MDLKQGKPVDVGVPRCCPDCGTKLDGATVVVQPGEPEESMPTAVDVTVCVYCGAILEFTADGFRHISPQTLEALTADERRALAVAQRAHAIWRRIRTTGK